MSIVRVSRTWIVVLIGYIKLISVSYVVDAWDISLQISQQVSDAVGGEPFCLQPIIKVYDRKGYTLHDDSLEDHVVLVELYESPVGYNNVLHHVDSRENDLSPYSTPLINGTATFTGLLINLAGEDYRLRFLLEDEHGIVLGHIIGESFSVVVGEAFEIDVIVQPESAFGGIPWGAQPVVAVHDRGSNIIPDFSNGSVSFSFSVFFLDCIHILLLFKLKWNSNYWPLNC